MRQEATLISVGDLILDIPQVDALFDPTREILKSGDIVMGQVEIPYTTRPIWSAYDRYSAPATDPVRRGEKGDDVLNHFKALCELEELNTHFEWNEDGTELILS